MEAAERKLPAFELIDQFERQHQVRFPTEKVIVIVAADRKGSPGVDPWIRPLVRRYGQKIELVGVADMSTVPVLLRPLVRKRFGQERRYPVMIDWDGRVTGMLSCEKGQANLVVLARDGRIVWQFAGAATKEQLAELYAAIDAAHLAKDRKKD